jgi:hypothetical protein
MQLIFAALGKACDGKRLSPEALGRLAGEYQIFERHRVIVTHRSAREMNSKHGQYQIEIVGAAVDGKWHFRQGELDHLARHACT